VTGYQSPTRFAFVAHDPNFGEVVHEFTISARAGRTLLERTVTAHMSPLIEFVWRLVIWPLADLPKSADPLSPPVVMAEAAPPAFRYPVSRFKYER